MKRSQRVTIIQNSTLLGLALGVLTIYMLTPRTESLNLAIGLWSVPVGTVVGWAIGFFYTRWLGLGPKR